ncbi:MAG: SWIM zinc finger family protein [Streptosporangiaceae bacterium]|nr:SWIM zinc finger family protein [Streptosporangiaceae bacterium]
MAAAVGFTEADIQRVAGPRSFGRGLDYLDSVADLEISDSRITAMVYGSHRYRVTLTAGDGQLAGSCTCPHSQEGFFCKHCVATGLAVLELGDDLPVQLQARQARETSLRSWLESMSKKELVAELLDLISDDPDLRRHFELRAAAEHADAPAIRLAVRELIMVTRYIDYDQAWDYANDVGKAADAIGSLIDAGGAAQAIGIAREAIALLTEAFESVDDSSGGIGDSAYQLLAVHLRACQTAPPDPVSLADYLAGLLLNDSYGFAPDLADYADLLDETGTARIRQRIAAAFSASPNDYRARGLMEDILEVEGDVDALVAFYASKLDDSGQAHLRIARVLDGADRVGEALGWAERGLREAIRPDNQLVDYLADRYSADGRTDDVLALRRSRFEAERTLLHYQALRRAAVDCGTWAADRAAALARLREDAHATPVRGYFNWAWAGPVLVNALIDDGDLGAAWTAVTTGPAKATATHDQRLRLADAVAATRPADALQLYLSAIEPLRSQTGDNTYQQVARLLLSARGCHERLGTIAEFNRYLAVLRADQKRKRNLMKILDANGL